MIGYTLIAEGCGLRDAFSVASDVRPRTTATFSKPAALGSGPHLLEGAMPVGLLEEWRDIPGYPRARYQVSSLGRIRSRWKQEWWIKKTPLDRRGYPSVSLHCHQIIQQYSVHRLVLECFVGPRPSGMECRHLDGNRQNNRLDNLAWGSRSENQRDRDRHGRRNAVHFRGESNPMAKVTADDVRFIRSHSHIGNQTLAKQFSLHPRYISLILSRRRWCHIE